MPQATVSIRVIPRAKRTELGPRRGEAFVVRLQAPPVEGAANKALSRFLAGCLGVRASDIRIVSGDKSRDKVVTIEGVTQVQAEDALCVPPT